MKTSVALIEQRKESFYFKNLKLKIPLMSFTRSLRSIYFFVISKNIGKTLISSEDSRLVYEQWEIFKLVRIQEQNEDFLILIYVKDNSIQ